jgi:ankyrin repeat protein
MLKLLLDKGAKLEDKILFTKSNPLPTFCVNFLIIKYLIKRGANPEATDINGNTLLHIQCKRGNLKNAKYLIQHYNADVSTKNRKGQTPLHLACYYNNSKLVKFLIQDQNADPASTCNEGKSALHYAAENIRDPSILRYIIEQQRQDIKATDNEEKTALHIASRPDCFFDHKWKVQKYLIKEYLKIIEAKDRAGKTSLYYCLQKFKKNKELFDINSFKSISLILATKAKILNTRQTDLVFDLIKQTYGWLKKSNEYNEAVSCLIAGLQKFQKQVGKKDATQFEYNPLLLIVSYCNRVDIAEYMFNQDLCYIENNFNAEGANFKRKLLLKSYLNFSCKNGLLDLTRFLFQEINKRQKYFQHLSFDGSFLKTACRKKQVDIFKYLLEDEKAKDEAAEFLKDFPLKYVCENGSLEMVQYLTEAKKIAVKGPSTLLWFTCRRGSVEITKYLIEKQNANVNTTDNTGRSLLHLACASSCLELVKYISMKTKSDVNAQDEAGSTALHLACDESGNIKVVKFLINDMQANLDLVDNKGRTPLHVACQSHYYTLSISKFLIRKGANALAKDKSGKSPLQIAKDENELEKEWIAFLNAAIKRSELVYNNKINY